jgi:hypothetical protein
VLRILKTGRPVAAYAGLPGHPRGSKTQEVTLRRLQLWERRPSVILGLEPSHLLPALDDVVISLNWGGTGDVAAAACPFLLAGQLIDDRREPTAVVSINRPAGSPRPTGRC